MYASTILFTLFIGLRAVSAAPAETVPEVMTDEVFYNLELPEFTPDGLKVVDMRKSNALESRGICGSLPGVANGECVRYYSDYGCPSQNHIKGYKPTCAGNCYVDKFYSVKAIGDGTYSTNCDLYSDTQCQNKITSVGGKTGGGHCANGDGWSMRCYYRC